MKKTLNTLSELMFIGGIGFLYTLILGITPGWEVFALAISLCLGGIGLNTFLNDERPQ